jgi:hypothetical protein
MSCLLTLYRWLIQTALCMGRRHSDGPHSWERVTAFCACVCRCVWGRTTVQSPHCGKPVDEATRRLWRSVRGESTKSYARQLQPPRASCCASQVGDKHGMNKKLVQSQRAYGCCWVAGWPRSAPAGLPAEWGSLKAALLKVHMAVEKGLTGCTLAGAEMVPVSPSRCRGHQPIYLSSSCSR